MIDYLNMLSDAIGESQFGIIIDSATEFFDFLKAHPEIRFTPGSDNAVEPDNLWDSMINNNRIMGVCCAEKWVIVPNSKRVAKYEYKWKEKHILELESLRDLLNDKGYKCSINVLRKQCGCT